MNLNFRNTHTTSKEDFNSLIIHLIKVKSLIVFCVFTSLCFALSCQSSDKGGNENDRMVAKVFNKPLFQSELNELVAGVNSPEDSAQIVHAYIEKWARSSVMMHEAEKYVPSDLDIDELVRNYRASLIEYNYEKLLVELNLDSTINENQLLEYYEENKEQYKLKQPIIKCRFIKIPKTAEDWSEAKRWWNSNKDDDFKKLVDYCSRNAEVYMLNDSIWYYLDDVSQHLPKGKLTSGNYTFNKSISTNDDNYEYLLKIYETMASDEYQPLELAKDQLTKVILHKRKIQLLDDKREEMYERETRNNNVIIYTN
jgi:hypothetical protein